MYAVTLVPCSRSDPEYKAIRDRHYIPNKGAIGQQLHYLIVLEREIVGIISGGSAAYATRARDDFFGITKENRRIALNGIIDNTVFRLERNLPNLGTQVLSMWRRRVAQDWEEKYHVAPCGFETFIIENENRKGAMYKADNWTFAGETSGSTKMKIHGADKPAVRAGSVRKLVFCKWIRGGVCRRNTMPHGTGRRSRMTGCCCRACSRRRSSCGGLRTGRCTARDSNNP